MVDAQRQGVEETRRGNDDTGIPCQLATEGAVAPGPGALVANPQTGTAAGRTGSPSDAHTRFKPPSPDSPERRTSSGDAIAQERTKRVFSSAEAEGREDGSPLLQRSPQAAAADGAAGAGEAIRLTAGCAAGAIAAGCENGEREEPKSKSESDADDADRGAGTDEGVVELQAKWRSGDCLIYLTNAEFAEMTFGELKERIYSEFAIPVERQRFLSLCHAATKKPPAAADRLSHLSFRARPSAHPAPPSGMSPTPARHKLITVVRPNDSRLGPSAATTATITSATNTANNATGDSSGRGNSSRASSADPRGNAVPQDSSSSSSSSPQCGARWSGHGPTGGASPPAGAAQPRASAVAGSPLPLPLATIRPTYVSSDLVTRLAFVLVGTPDSEQLHHSSSQPHSTDTETPGDGHPNCNRRVADDNQDDGEDQLLVNDLPNPSGAHYYDPLEVAVAEINAENHLRATRNASPSKRLRTDVNINRVRSAVRRIGRLPFRHTPKPGSKLLVVDVDQTVLDCRFAPNVQPHVLVRPHLSTLLDVAMKLGFELCLWSKTRIEFLKEKKGALFALLKTDFDNLCFSLDRSAMCVVKSPEGEDHKEIKPLEVVWTLSEGLWGPHNTLHVDDDAKNFALNPKNGILVSPYRKSLFEVDNELLLLSYYLKAVVSQPDFTDRANSGQWRRIATELMRQQVTRKTELSDSEALNERLAKTKTGG